MKKHRLWIERVGLISMLCSLLLTGCWDRTEINDLAIVLATGVDYVDEKVQLTAQIFIPRKGSGGAESGSSGTSASGVTMTRTAEGQTIAEALNRLQRKVARNMFWGHCEVIVISEQAGKNGIREYIDFLLRYPQFREHAYVFSSSEAAKDVLAILDPLERSSAESLREMANMKLGTRVTVLQLAQSIEGPSRSAILSRMLILPTEPGQDRLATTPYLKGLSLYKNDTYVKTVQEPLSLGVLLLSNELDNIIMPVEVKPSKGSFSIRAVDVKTVLVPHIRNQEWTMEIHIHSKGEVVLNTTDDDLTDPSKMAKLQQAWTDRLKELAEKALQMSQKELKSDFFKFATQFRRYYPHQWTIHQQEWEKIYSEMNVNIDVKVAIVSTGKSIGPQGIPEQSAY
ncbi:Ger(x)C family spore germination protein [Paenibacillus sp. BIC5C1]|uniref:Ger(x)C family spore germination protein n=1 Tax=Paenibacillus sp. BIC5C1 TaxID=3078263 RepID=UPI0028E46DB1|nr:Ger(x)C family spore germination protein [Paenibacillus sp. BIC5C1]